VVDELEHAGAPDQLTIRARSADFRDSSTAKRSQSYHQVTLGAIVSTVAARHALSPVVASDLSGTALPHIDQIQESDWHFLTLLAERYDAIATVKAGCCSSSVGAPQGIDDVMSAFTRLKSFGLDPMDGTVKAITDQTAKLGGGQETLEGIVLAVGQAWATQKLQGEEIMQLVERG
jgi:hypothetical protein